MRSVWAVSDLPRLIAVSCSVDDMDQRGDQHLYTNYVLLSVVAFVLQLHIAVSKGCHNSPYRIRSMLCTNI